MGKVFLMVVRFLALEASSFDIFQLLGKVDGSLVATVILRR